MSKHSSRSLVERCSSVVDDIHASNFNSYVLFNYAYPNEDYDLNLGFVASKQPNQKNLLSTGKF